MVLSHNKRQYNDDEYFRIPCKHSRKHEHESQFVSYAEIFPCAPLEEPHTFVEDKENLDIIRSSESLEDDLRTETSVLDYKKSESSSLDSISDESLATSIASEEDRMLEPPLQTSQFPHLFDYPREIGQMQRSPLPLEHPRKVVPIGPDHQAILPEWNPSSSKISGSILSTNSSLSVQCSNGTLNHLDAHERFMGTCILPMPNSETYAQLDRINDYNKILCNCLDKGTIQCVRGHVTEARERLRTALGSEKFEDLGFSDMGESVANQWSLVEEHMFHETIFSIPASLGRNFWHNLSFIFPKKTKKELVSYYFNVFILRKRAKQNRLTPLNADSDNDQWEGREYEDESFTDDEDSDVEMPLDRDAIHQIEQYKDFDDYSDDDDDEVFNSSTLEGRIRLSNGSNLETKVRQNAEDQDDLCLTDGANSCGEHLLQDHFEHECLNTLEPSDPKEWDMCYLMRSNNNVEFLPTSNVIKEMLGGEEEEGRHE